MARPPKTDCPWWWPHSDLVPQDGQMLAGDGKGERHFVLAVLGTYHPITLGYLAIRCTRTREKDDLGKTREVITPLGMALPAGDINLEKQPAMDMTLLCVEREDVA